MQQRNCRQGRIEKTRRPEASTRRCILAGVSKCAPIDLVIDDDRENIFPVPVMLEVWGGAGGNNALRNF